MRFSWQATFAGFFVSLLLWAFIGLLILMPMTSDQPNPFARSGQRVWVNTTITTRLSSCFDFRYTQNGKPGLMPVRKAVEETYYPLNQCGHAEYFITEAFTVSPEDELIITSAQTGVVFNTNSGTAFTLTRDYLWEEKQPFFLMALGATLFFVVFMNLIGLGHPRKMESISVFEV